MTTLSAQPGFWALVRDQHGAVSLDQLRGFGLTEGALRHRLGEQLHPVHRGVYAVGRPDLPLEGEWMAAVLACGAGAALSHESAAALLGILGRTAGPIHVSVPPGRQPRHRGVVAHRRSSMPEVTRHARIPVTGALATLVDIAERSSARQLETALNEADKLGFLRADRARAQLEDMPRRAGVGKLKRILDSHKVTDSDLERRFLRTVRRVSMPTPSTQVFLAGHRVDFFWPDIGLVVETDGLTYHRTAAQQARDRRRDQDLTAAGFTCLRFTNAQVRYEARAVAATLAAVRERLRTR